MDAGIEPEPRADSASDAPADASQASAPPRSISPRSLPSAWSWLGAHPGQARFGFLRRDGTGTLGVGIRDVVEGDTIVEVLAALRGRDGTWFVGGRFDPDGPRQPWWAPFGGARAWRTERVLPLPVSPGPQVVRPESVVPTAAPPPGHHPDLDGWRRAVHAAIRQFSTGELDKVVLARAFVELTSVRPLTWLEGGLGTREMAFLVEPEPGVAFAGLTPELLFDRQGDQVRSEALAGTDVDTPEGRERLASSDKIAREHAMVVEAVKRSLAPLCSTLEPSPLRLAATGRLVHRLVSFEGTLGASHSDADLAERLHPTPAVAGTPRDRALAFIREHEPLDRGWYGGPVGLVTPERTTLAVALRCALWRGPTRIAYAGAGLVPGSDAAAEWEETRLKSLVVRER